MYIWYVCMVSGRVSSAVLTGINQLVGKGLLSVLSHGFCHKVQGGTRKAYAYAVRCRQVQVLYIMGIIRLNNLYSIPFTEGSRSLWADA